MRAAYYQAFVVAVLAYLLHRNSLRQVHPANRWITVILLVAAGSLYVQQAERPPGQSPYYQYLHGALFWVDPGPGVLRPGR